MIYITGDCHGEFTRFSTRKFPQQKNMSKERDMVIILGDSGFLFDGSRTEEHWLDWFEAKPWITVDVGGNHANYDLSEQYPLVPFHGGTARMLRPSVFQLSRGQVFRFGELSVFAMGGAESHDGLILRRGEDLERRKRQLKRLGKLFRVEGISWWPQELPSTQEMGLAAGNLQAVNYKVDLVLTHCAPGVVQKKIAPDGDYPENMLTRYFDCLYDVIDCKKWYFGHYHKSWTDEDGRCQSVYEAIIPIEESEVSHDGTEN